MLMSSTTTATDATCCLAHVFWHWYQLSSVSIVVELRQCEYSFVAPSMPLLVATGTDLLVEH